MNCNTSLVTTFGYLVYLYKTYNFVLIAISNHVALKKITGTSSMYIALVNTNIVAFKTNKSIKIDRGFKYEE